MAGCAPPPPPHGPTPILSHVRWHGPEDQGARLQLQPQHPGRLLFAGEAHAVIDWTDAVGELQYAGPFDPDWLQLLSEQEHRQNSARLRASGWRGFPHDDAQAMALWGQDRWPPPVESFESGTAVRFTGEARTAEQLALQPGHPGRVSSSGAKHVVVDWADVEGGFQHEGIMWPEWLEPLAEEDYQRDAEALRRSGWRGFAAHGQHGVNRPE